ncbi:acyl CoA--acetate/3-ketoacid CoA transferase subunit alpha [Tsukamurella sp. 8F]|uniref:CoA transferase subunit A n=1 Tax=unclassified Tsukamurella TaxID=2633480 RepID=UPI0023B940BA|nr:MULTISPECIES: CoA-transferase [unclassified Tsukamurella]MDF0528378.1 acyl CoA--acetate/3-ketoacid CoA transferase subunit alpha [Tsukamurella sp. 8J]MDF0586203.1 acyl CoA--acetate/3-ketoacid CoA transferase subunit alpha [Tsukamurella sp. 8F]
MGDKTMPLDRLPGRLRSGMTLGIGGWGSRRKPMAMVREVLRSDITDLTVVTFGGPDVGLLCAAGRVRHLIYGFVSLDSIPLDPHFRAAREAGTVETTEYDEGMFVAALRAGANRLSFMPIRAGMASDVMTMNPGLKTVRSPYDDDEYVAVPGIRLDAALIHVNRADAIGNGQYLGPDPYFDDLFAMAADETYMSAERIVPTAELTATASHHTLLISRLFTSGVLETPNGAHFTSCEPDHPRDEAFQKHYASAAADGAAWAEFTSTYLSGDESAYQDAVAEFSSSAAKERA